MFTVPYAEAWLPSSLNSSFCHHPPDSKSCIRTKERKITGKLLYYWGSVAACIHHIYIYIDISLHALPGTRCGNVEVHPYTCKSFSFGDKWGSSFCAGPPIQTTVWFSKSFPFQIGGPSVLGRTRMSFSLNS